MTKPQKRISIYLADGAIANELLLRHDLPGLPFLESAGLIVVDIDAGLLPSVILQLETDGDIDRVTAADINDGADEAEVATVIQGLEFIALPRADGLPDDIFVLTGPDEMLEAMAALRERGLDKAPIMVGKPNAPDEPATPTGQSVFAAFQR